MPYSLSQLIIMLLESICFRVRDEAADVLRFVLAHCPGGWIAIGL